MAQMQQKQTLRGLIGKRNRRLRQIK